MEKLKFENPTAFEEEELLKDFKEEGFNIEQKLKEVKGPFIEIAGPTRHGYVLVNIDNLGKKLYISDVKKKEKLDFMADAKNLPIKNNSVGALFVSYLGGWQKDSPPELKEIRKEIRKWRIKEDIKKDVVKEHNRLSDAEQRSLKDNALKEAYRVIENGGLLIWEGGSKEDIETAQGLGFIIKELKGRRILTGQGLHSCIFEKNE